MLPDITNVVNEKVDWLAILVTGENTEMLFGVPKISKGTGETMAEITVANLAEWGIKEQVLECDLIQPLATQKFMQELVH